MQKTDIVIIGAGPAGLGVSYELSRSQINDRLNLTILDKNEIVGGLARTHQYQGYRFDVGPHRFFTKNEEILRFWKEVLGDELIEVSRLTRMLYRNQLFLYPVQLQDIMKKLGPWKISLIGLSYLHAKIFWRSKKTETFEDWIKQNFGSKLYEMFFKTYTEKVWGIPCHEIGAEWAAQRIKGLNLIEVVKNAFFGEKSRKAKSLVSKFYYPIQGAGLLYERLAQISQTAGHSIQLRSLVSKIRHRDGKIHSIIYQTEGRKIELPIDHLFSSMPLTHFIFALDPKPDKAILRAARKLFYRDHITVNLIIKKDDLFPDNWIYVHSPEVKMARIANYNNFSNQMVGQNGYSAVSVEYFVFKNDEVWSLNDNQLIELAKGEMDQVQLVNRHDVVDGFVMRETESYPTYYMGHKPYFDLLKNYVGKFSNLQLIGRGGMYKYNNQDHATYSGILAARNFIEGYQRYDIWQINEDAEYLEENKEPVTV